MISNIQAAGVAVPVVGPRAAQFGAIKEPFAKGVGQPASMEVTPERAGSSPLGPWSSRLGSGLVDLKVIGSAG